MVNSVQTIAEPRLAIPDSNEQITVKSVFPLRRTTHYKYLKEQGEIADVAGFETTRFMLENGYFNLYKTQIAEGLEKVKRTRMGTSQSIKRTYKPIKQSRDDARARTCVVASTVNIMRALGKEITETELLRSVGENFGDNGNLPIDTFTERLKQEGFTKKYISERDPEELIEAIQSGYVVQAVWEDHSRVISGMFSGEDGETFLIVNDSLSDQPEAYAVSLQEIYSVPISWDNLTLVGYKAEAQN